MKILIPKQSGFTLIELLIYISLLTAVMLETLNFSYQFLDSVSSIQNSIAVEGAGNFILQKASYDFQKASPVIIPTMPPSLSPTGIAISTSSISFSIKNHDFSFTPFIENK